MNKSEAIFKSKKALPFLTMISVLAWAAAFPFIKLGMAAFAISSADTASETFFAGIRFSAAGLIVILFAAINGCSFKLSFKDFLWVLSYAVLNTTMQYFFFYVGLSHSPGSRASILNSIGTFMLVLISCLFFKDERLTLKRVIGCIVGFSGLVLLNIGADSSGAFTFIGDGMIILSATCSAFGGILTRVAGQRISIPVLTGLGLLIGGAVLTVGGYFAGGRIETVTSSGIIDLAVLILSSAVGFSIYNKLLLYHPVGQVAIYNSLIPVFGIILSCLMLGEPFLPKYIVAAVLVAAGVFTINFVKNKPNAAQTELKESQPRS